MPDTVFSRSLLISILCFLVACRPDVGDGKAPPLLKVSQERLESFNADKKAKRALLEEDINSNNDDPTAFASQAQVERFIVECTNRKDEDDGTVRISAGKGLLWKGGGEAMDVKPPKNGEFSWIEGNSEFMDPNRVSESSGNALASQMFEPLMVIAPGNDPPRYGAAESHTISKDGKTYTFKLRKGLVWSDGTKLTAEDFRYSWLRGLSPEIASKNASQMTPFIKGASAYNQGKEKDPDTVGIRALDESTLEVELLYPTPFFLDLLTYIAYAPVPKHAIDKHGDRWTRPENIVVNGPYTMMEWKPRAKMVFGKNPNYWDRDSVQIEKHTAVLTGNDGKANANLYANGQVQTAQPLPQEKVKKWIQESRLDLKIAEQMGTYYYVFRTDRPPFNNRLIRKAFNMALDKERLTDLVLGGFQPPAQNLIPDGFVQSQSKYKVMKGDDYNVEGAMDFLAAAGYSKGSDLGKIDLVYNTSDAHKTIAVFYQRNMKDNLGVDLALTNMEWKSLLKKVKTGDFQLARTSWIADYPDPLNFLKVWDSESANNYAAYKNPAYDDLLDRIQQTTDNVKRNALICAAEMVLNYDVPISPIYFYTRPYLLHPSVDGYEPQYQDHHLIKYVSYRR